MRISRPGSKRRLGRAPRVSLSARCRQEVPFSKAPRIPRTLLLPSWLLPSWLLTRCNAATRSRLASAPATPARVCGSCSNGPPPVLFGATPCPAAAQRPSVCRWKTRRDSGTCSANVPSRESRPSHDPPPLLAPRLDALSRLLAAPGLNGRPTCQHCGGRKAAAERDPTDWREARRCRSLPSLDRAGRPSADEAPDQLRPATAERRGPPLMTSRQRAGNGVARVPGPRRPAPDRDAAPALGRPARCDRLIPACRHIPLRPAVSRPARAHQR